MIRKFILLLFVSVTFAGSSYSQTEISLVKQGLEYSYNFNFAKADSVYNILINEYPDSPSGFHFLSQNFLWKYMGGRDSADLIIFNRFSKLALERAANIDSPSNFNAYITSSIHALQAIASTFAGNSWDAFLESKSAVNGFEELIDSDNKYYDAYAGLAVFDYALSELPALYKLALDITGLSHDKDKAIKYFNITYEKGNLAKDEAAFHLSKVNFEFTGDYVKALKYIDELLTKYPNNILFKYQKALIKIEQHKLDTAEKILTGIIDSKIDNFQQTIAYSYFLLGEIYFKRNNFKKALYFYEKFFANTKVVDYLGYANLRCAFASYFIGDKPNLKRYLILASNGNLDIAEDKFAEEISEILIKKGISDELEKFILAENNYYAGNYEQCLLDASSDSLSNFKSVNIIAAAALNKLSRYRDSERISERLQGNEFLFDYLEPFLYLIRGENNYYLSNFELADEFLGKAKAASTGYREKFIHSQANRFLYLINKK